MAIRSGEYSARALGAALDRQSRLEDTVAIQRAGNGDWPVTQPSFDERGLGGQFAKSLSDRKFAGDVKFWQKLFDTGRFSPGAEPTGTDQNGGIS